MVSSSLVDQFLTADNRIKVGALAVAGVGGSLYAIFIGFIKGTLTFGELFQMVVGGLTDTIFKQSNRYLAAYEGNLGAMWDPLNVGILSYPVNLAIILALMGLTAWGVRSWRN